MAKVVVGKNPMYENRKRNAQGDIGPETNEVYFTPPDGVELDGDSGEAMIKWAKEGDKYVITAIDGVSMSGEQQMPHEREEMSMGSENESEMEME